MNITFIHADGPLEYNSAHWRSTLPAEAFNRTRRHSAKLLGIHEFTSHPAIAEYHCKDADAIIIQRGAMPPTWPAIEHWRQRGKIVISDIDDGYPQIPPEHPAHAFWHRGISRSDNGQAQQMPRPAILEMADGLKVVNGLTSPNRLILDDWRKAVGVKGAFIPNYPEVKTYEVKRTRSPKDDGMIWVAWGGSAGHLQSFTQSGVLMALARVISTRPHVRMIYVGSDPRIMDAIPLREGQKQHFLWRRYDDWPKLVANFDIGLVPVAGEFDARRSWIKPMEYSLLNVPWIASKSPAYDELEAQSLGVFVDNDPNTWADALADMIDNGANETVTRRAYKWARSLNIDDHIDEMATIYRSFGQ